MARARNIKPGFFKNEDLAECSLAARLCFAGLWTLADREGRLEDRPKRIKGELFAFDSVEVEPLLVELQRYGFILRYEAENRGFIQIIAFHKHQNPHHKEPPSVIPSPESPGFYPHGTSKEPEALHSLHDSKTLDRTEASPGLLVDESSKHGGKTVLNPDSLFSDSSEAKASDGKPSGKSADEKSKTELWKSAVSLLGGQGIPETQARSLMGKLVQDYKSAGEDIVLKAVRGAVSEQPADARAYLRATCQRLAGERKRDGTPDWTASAI